MISLRFIEYYYTNAFYFYRRIDGKGREQWRASGSSIFYSLGICMLGVNVVQQFTGSLAPLVREIIPAANRPYDNAAEYAFAIPFAFILNYKWLWKNTDILKKRYKILEAQNSRWMLLFGLLMSLAFALICGYGRVNFWFSLGIAIALLFLQELIYVMFLKSNKGDGDH